MSSNARGFIFLPGLVHTHWHIERSLVFRFPQPPSVRLDDPDRAEIEEQWGRLKVFLKRNSVTPLPTRHSRNARASIWPR